DYYCQVWDSTSKCILF
nr:immunoglobulin light chain junction region [Macaca mulatta]